MGKIPRKAKKTMALEDKIREALSAAGLTADQIGELENRGLETAAEARHLTVEDLVEVGVKPFKARAVHTQISDAITEVTATKPKLGDAQANPTAAQGIAQKLGLPDVATLMMLATQGNGGMFNALINTDSLVDLYEPEPDNLAGNMLERKYPGIPIVPFIAGTNEVAREGMKRYLRDLKRGRPAVTRLSVDGKLFELYPIGMTPNDMMEEDVFAPGEVAWDGQSKANVSLKGLDTHVLQLLWSVYSFFSSCQPLVLHVYRSVKL